MASSVNNFRTGNLLHDCLLVTARPEDLNYFEGLVSTSPRLQTVLASSNLAANTIKRNAPPQTYHYDGKQWQAAHVTIPPANDSLIAKIVAAADNAVAFALFQTERASRTVVTRSYNLTNLPDNFDIQAAISELQKILLDKRLGLASLDIAPGHILRASVGDPIQDSPTLLIKPRTVNTTNPEQLFKAQKCWANLNAQNRNSFSYKGDDVTVVVFDTAPDLAQIDPTIVNYVIDHSSQNNNFGRPLLKPLYPRQVLNSVATPRTSLNMLFDSQFEVDRELEISDLQPYHGILAASLIHELAPEAKIVLVEVLNDDGETDSTNLLDALDYILFLRRTKAEINGERLIKDNLVINLSLGYPRSLVEEVDVPYLLEFCDRAAEAGVLVVCSAGNDSNEGHPRNPQEPAAYGYFEDTAKTITHVIPVAATGLERSSYAWFSNQSNLGAPGFDILMDSGATFRHSGTRHMIWSGSSFATPLVSATVALLLNKGTAPATVKQQLWSTSTPPARWTGVNALDVAKALQ